MRRSKASTHRWAWAVVAAVSIAGGCSDYCDVYCDCEGCSDREYDECIDDFEDEESRADRRDCLPEWDEYLACVDDTADCRGDDLDVDCGPEWRDYRECVD